jgi:hypothetical protein
MPHWHRRLLSMWVLACAWGMAVAQSVSLPPSAALACMTPSVAERGLPSYPSMQLERKTGATIRVELAFAGPETEPSMRLLDEGFVSPDFVEAIQSHVRRLRVPCMAPGAEPVRVAQTFVFRPDDGRNVVALPPRDTATEDRRRLSRCLTRITPQTVPDYPTRARREGTQGNYLVRLRFDSPAAPPQMEIVAGPPDRYLRRALAEFVSGYRLPCQEGAALEIDLIFQFQLEGGSRVLLNDMSLRQFLGAARRVPPGRFDFGTMGCPFDLRVNHLQPYKPHAIGQIGEARADRLDFIEWLSGIALKLDSRTALAVLGDSFTLGVPCGTLDF